MTPKPDFIGAKGGSNKQRTPVESPDSLRSLATFRILDLISEGEIGGLVNGLQSIYLDETPLQNADLSLNFSGVTVDSRTGTQDQTYIPGYPAVESEIAVGVELKSSTPWIRQITNTQLSGVRITLSVPALMKTDTSNGDVTGYSIAYTISISTDGGPFVTAYNGQITGKATSTYQHSDRVDLPPASTGWQVRVMRTTPNANSATIQDTTNIDSYTEIIDAKLRYPNSALLAISADASQFQSIPSRGYDVWLRIVQVPSNYDPKTRVYSGVWDGTFKPAWTDNPAWCFYDLALNPRYGLGNLLSGAQLDKWELYRIAQYCDQLVDDGKGGQEPRFTCNIFLQSQEDAYKMLSDMASVFNGISYWTGGAIVTRADMPDSPQVLYTQANVIDGKFSYSSSPRKTRYTTALVTWNDPGDFYRQKTEYVADPDGLARYGIQQTQISAFGCTSQGQAQRVGRWAILSSLYETDTVSFSVGLDGALVSPGQIIRVADAARAGKRQGGRVRSGTKSGIVTDAPPGAVAPGDTLTVWMPSGVTESSIVSAVVGNSINVNPIFTQAPNPGAAWAVESATLATQLFRVLSVEENTSDAAMTFTVTALQHNPSKFAAIDSGTLIQIPPISGITPNNQAAPTNVTLTGHVVITQGIATNVLTIAWNPAPGALFYRVEWRRDDGQWVAAGQTGQTNMDIQGIYTGTYVARVRAISPSNIVSIPAYGGPTAIEGKTGAPPTVAFLTTESQVFGIKINWGFPPGAEDTSYTELRYGSAPDFGSSTLLSQIAYPTNYYLMQGLAAGVGFYFWARLVDKTGNIGAWYPADTAQGVYGESSTDANAILDYLTGQITETQLSKDLQEQIDKIPVMETDIQEIAEQLGAVEGEIDQINGIISYYDPKMAGDTTGFAGDDLYYAGVWSEQYARASSDVVLAKNIDTVAVLAGDNQAAIQTETQARIDQDGVLASQVTDVQAVANNAFGTAQQAQADVKTETTARISGDQVNAQATQTVAANLGNTNANVQTNANAISTLNGTVSASYNIKVQIDPGTGKYYSAGMAIGIDNSSGTVQSQVLFLADRFAVLSMANGQVYSPFIIQNGQAFISQAFIGNAWITSANIQDAAITSAKISQQIQSDNYDGTNGWAINKNGNAYFGGNVVVRGDVSGGTISGLFQRTASINWNGTLTGGSYQEVARCQLGAPVRAGESHTPCITLSFDSFYNSNTASWAISYIQIERSTDGNTWTTLRRIASWTAYNITWSNASMTFDNPVGGPVYYRVTIEPTNNVNASIWQLKLVQMFVQGIR